MLRHYFESSSPTTTQPLACNLGRSRPNFAHPMPAQGLVVSSPPSIRCSCLDLARLWIWVNIWVTDMYYVSITLTLCFETQCTMGQPAFSWPQSVPTLPCIMFSSQTPSHRLMVGPIVVDQIRYYILYLERLRDLCFYRLLIHFLVFLYIQHR